MHTTNGIDLNAPFRFTMTVTNSKGQTRTIFDGVVEPQKEVNMASSKNSSWKGWEDSTPSAMPMPPDKQGSPGPDDTTGDWKGMSDSTPSSMPTTPDKEP